MSRIVRFTDDTVREAISDNYCVPLKDVVVENYTDEQIVESLDWYIRNQALSGMDIEDVLIVVQEKCERGLDNEQ